MKLPWKLGWKLGCVKGRIVKVQGKEEEDGIFEFIAILDYV